MDNKKELYYKLEYIMPQKCGGGDIKIKIEFNKYYMEYFEIDVITGTFMKHIYINGYDYDLAIDVLLEAMVYRSNWLFLTWNSSKIM